MDTRIEEEEEDEKEDMDYYDKEMTA